MKRHALIVAAAFVVKLVVLMQLWSHPLLQPHGELDTAYYVSLRTVGEQDPRVLLPQSIEMHHYEARRPHGRAMNVRRLDGPRFAMVQTATFFTRSEEPAWPRRKQSC